MQDVQQVGEVLEAAVSDGGERSPQLAGAGDAPIWGWRQSLAWEAARFIGSSAPRDSHCQQGCDGASVTP